MRPPPLLLHMLLSLALVANGIGAAVASAHAGCAHSATVAAVSIAQFPAEQPALDEPPCHGDIAPEPASPMHDGKHHGGHASLPAEAHDGAGDCGNACDGACTCDCTAHCQAALMPPTTLLHVSARIAHAESSSYTHTAPALPHPVRPPIG